MITDNLYLKIIIQLVICSIGLAGFGTGYNFSLLASKVNKENVGKCFATGYAIGSIGTYLLMQIPKLDLFSSSYLLLVFIPTTILIIILIMKYGNIIEEEKQNEISKEKKDVFLCDLFMT